MRFTLSLILAFAVLVVASAMHKKKDGNRNLVNDGETSTKECHYGRRPPMQQPPAQDSSGGDDVADAGTEPRRRANADKQRSSARRKAKA